MKVSEFTTTAERSAYLFGVLEMQRRVIEAFGETRPSHPTSIEQDTRVKLLDAIDEQGKALMAEIESANSEVLA